VRRAFAPLIVVAFAVAGCGGSSDTTSSTGGATVQTSKPTAPERRPAAAALLGAASRYVDARVADGRLPRVHVGRGGVVGKVGIAYLIGGSDVGGAGGETVKGLYGVLVLLNRGGTWHVEPPAIAFGGHS
jgi:hypothetical protein